MSSRSDYKELENGNKEVFEKLNRSSKERLMDFGKKQWIAEAFTYAGLNVQSLDFIEIEDKLTEGEWKKLSAIMDRQMKKLVSFIQEENWLQLELTLAYYYNLRYDIEE